MEMTVENHKDAIKRIVSELNTLAGKKREVKKAILGMKYSPEGAARPETGPERAQLWGSYVYPHRHRARMAHLALGYLRGRPYSSIEGKTELPKGYVGDYFWREIAELVLGVSDLAVLTALKLPIQDWFSGRVATSEAA
jgi:hypothetical protein